jgi:hypothetical protein
LKEPYRTMIRRDPPAKPPLEDVPERLAKSHQMKVWVERLLDTPEDEVVDLDDLDPALLTHLTEELMKRRNIRVPTTQFRQYMRELTPVLSCPQFDDPSGDTRCMFALGAMQEFWRSWTLHEAADDDSRGGSYGERGPNAMTRGVKATLLTMSSPGSTSLVKHAHRTLTNDRALMDVYSDLMWQLHGADGDPQFSVPAYKGGVARHWKPLLGAARKPALRANIAIIKALRELDERRLPPGQKSRIGRGLLTDGTMIVAWAQQWAPARSLSDAERARMEEELRRWAPDATFRAYSQRSDGSKIEIEEDPNLAGSVRRNSSKHWRGFLLCAIVDQATGLPLVWTLIRNREYEGVALLTMLAELHELWPDLDAEWIAGDGLYDDDDLARICVQNYGIHPIFRHNTRNSAKLGRAADGKLFDQLDKAGRAICRRHKAPMHYVEYTGPKRDGLRPGQASPPGAIDMRIKCVTDHRATGGRGPCGHRIRIDVSGDWSRLVKYPHHADGHPRRYAFRKAVEQRLNGVESAWAALKGGHGLGVGGAARPRIRDMPVYEGSISLAFLQRAALTLWDQLDRNGHAPPPLARRPVRATLLTEADRVPMRLEYGEGGPTITIEKPVTLRSHHPLVSGRRGRRRPRSPNAG